MPKMPLSSETKAKNTYEFPKLWLSKGERARIVLLDPVPQTEYVHTMRAPQIVNGKPQFQTNQKGQQEMKYDFVGRHICLGSFDVIADKGLDPKVCPVCAESLKSDAVKPPERRHALNVIRYKTQPGTFKVQEPYLCEVAVWAFADRLHSQLVDFAEEWGDLRAHDLALGPCEAEMYQKMEINVQNKAEWMATPQRKQLTAEVFRNNMINDLTVAIGRKLSREQVLEDLHKVLERHAVASGKAAAAPVTVEEVDVSGILDVEESVPSTEPVVELEAMPPTAPAKSSPKKSPPSDASDLMDLEDILNL